MRRSLVRAAVRPGKKLSRSRAWRTPAPRQATATRHWTLIHARMLSSCRRAAKHFEHVRVTSLFGHIEEYTPANRAMLKFAVSYRPVTQPSGLQLKAGVWRRRSGRPRNRFKGVKSKHSSQWYPHDELRDVTCHMRSHSVTCYPTQENAPRPGRRRVLDLPTPEGWKAELT